MVPSGTAGAGFTLEHRGAGPSSHTSKLVPKPEAKSSPALGTGTMVLWKGPKAPPPLQLLGAPRSIPPPHPSRAASPPAARAPSKAGSPLAGALGQGCLWPSQLPPRLTGLFAAQAMGGPWLRVTSAPPACGSPAGHTTSGYRASRKAAPRSASLAESPRASRSLPSLRARGCGCLSPAITRGAPSKYVVGQVVPVLPVAYAERGNRCGPPQPSKMGPPPAPPQALPLIQGPPGNPQQAWGFLNSRCPPATRLAHFRRILWGRGKTHPDLLQNPDPT